MIEFDMGSNAGNLRKQLQQLQKQLPVITQQAMKESVFKARNDARKSAKKNLHKPRQQTLDAIKARYPNRSQVIAGNAVAEVFIDPSAVSWLGPNVIQEKETSTPKRGKNVLQPTKNLKLNRHGNIHGFHGGRVRRMRKNKAVYLDVPLDNKAMRTKHLTPGLYKRVKNGRRSELVMVLRYKKSRTIKPKWTEYPTVVGNSYQRNYVKLWKAGYKKELGKIARQR